MALKLNKNKRHEETSSDIDEIDKIFDKKNWNAEEIKAREVGDDRIEENDISLDGKKRDNQNNISLEGLDGVNEKTKTALEDRLLREPIKFKTDTAIHQIIEGMYDWMRLQTGISKKQIFWDTLISFGKDNLPENPMKDLIHEYVRLRRSCSQIISTDIIPVVDLNRHGRTRSLNLYLKQDQLGIISDIKNSYFIRPPEHPDVPYIMLMVSFIYSNYGNDMMEEFRDVVKPFYDTMIANIRNLEVSIYNLNISILSSGRFFIPPNKVHLWIDYLTFLVDYFDKKSDFNNPDIKNQMELIANYCEYVNIHLDLFREENHKLDVEKFGKLYDWTRTKKISGNPDGENCE